MDLWIDCRELFLRLGDDEVLIIDCREEEEWTRLELQIPGALRMSFEDLVESAHILPDDELIILYGAARDGSDSRRASRILQLRGWSAFCLRGGLLAWIAEGYPTERQTVRTQRTASGQSTVGIGDR